MQKERYQGQIDPNFPIVCHTEVCFTFLSLTVKLLEMITKFQGLSLKIQQQSSFDLNGTQFFLKIKTKRL